MNASTWASIINLTICFAIPLMLVALGGMYSERSGVINLALEGIMIIGALAACLVLRAMDQAGTDPAHTAMLGDKLLTDMLGANLSGVTALMVEPADGARTPWQKVLHALQAPWKYLAGGVHRI